MPSRLPFRALRPVLAGAAALVALVSAAPAATAQGAAREAGADEQEIARYTLTMPALRKSVTATEKMLQAVITDDGLARQLAADSSDDDNLSLDDIVARYDRVPAFKRAITSSGLTPREYIVMQLAMMQAAMVVGFQDPENTGKEITIPEGVSKANVAFVRANWKELQQMGQKAQALQRQLDAKQGAEEPEEPEEPAEGEEPGR